MKLRSEVIDRIVVRLIGIYGQQFHGKYSRIESGVDVGIAMFKDALATELANFADNLDAIKYALDNLPSTHCPNALELRDIARRAPRKQVEALPYKPTAEDIERNRRIISPVSEMSDETRIAHHHIELVTMQNEVALAIGTGAARGLAADGGFSRVSGHHHAGRCDAKTQ